MTPPLVDIEEMNLQQYVLFNCDADHTVSNVWYANGFLTVVTEFTTDLEGKICDLTMSFDPNIILSDSFSFQFRVESDNIELTISNNLTMYQTIKLHFIIISFVTLGVFVLSLGHKMIGAELLSSVILVYLSLVLYGKVPFLVNSMNELQNLSGYWVFILEEYEDVLPALTERVLLSPYFL